MKHPNQPVITASLTALVTLSLVAALFFLPSWPTVTQAKLGADASVTSPPKSSRLSSSATLAPNQPAAMTIREIDEIVLRLDTAVERPRKGFWKFTIEGAAVVIVGDEKHDRLRILVGISDAKKLKQSDLEKIAQSNFDTALDARYAISQDVLWAIYVHPIKSLQPQQLLSAIGQTVNLAKSYGEGYSSGGILFEGGGAKDSRRNRMIEALIKKGLKS